MSGRYRLPLAVRARQLPRAMTRALKHPRWFAESLLLLRRRRKQSREDFSLCGYYHYRATEYEAFRRLLDVSDSDYRQASDVSWWPTSVLEVGPDEQFSEYNGTPELLRVVGIAIRLLRPEIVLELGVARGLSSAVALAALAQNEKGHLHSIDLPPLAVNPGRFVGERVPEALKCRWTLHLGPSRLLLPGLLDRVGSIDIFLHDGDHTYSSMIDEFRLAWPHLRPGGLLLADDVWVNAAFFDFADEVGCAPLIIMGAEDTSPLGLLGKP